jgi:hypothetical protein
VLNGFCLPLHAFNNCFDCSWMVMKAVGNIVMMLGVMNLSSFQHISMQSWVMFTCLFNLKGEPSKTQL